jgi:hypothetical protein
VLLSPASWLILALAAVSCGGDATGPTPGTEAGSWAGPMKITTQITGDGINLVIVADGTLRWSRDDGDLTSLRGGALYTPASGGRLTVTYAQQVSGCSEGGTGPLPNVGPGPERRLYARHGIPGIAALSHASHLRAGDGDPARRGGVPRGFQPGRNASRWPHQRRVDQAGG